MSNLQKYKQRIAKNKALAKNILHITSEYLRRAGKNLLNFQQLPQKQKLFRFSNLVNFWKTKKIFAAKKD